jgi:hypothetical protein
LRGKVRILEEMVIEGKSILGEKKLKNRIDRKNNKVDPTRKIMR